MELNKENIKKIIILIIFTVLLFVGIQNINGILQTAKAVIGMLSPFLLGAGIAFIVNVPMRFIEKTLFKSPKLKSMKRPTSILLALACIIGVIFIVFFIIIPEIAHTIKLLIDSIPDSVTKVQGFLSQLVEDYPEINDYVMSFEVNWNELVKNILTYVQSFTSGFFSSTVGVVSSIVSGVMNFIIGFVFAIYILSQKESLSKQCKKIIYAIFSEKRGDRIIGVCQLAESTFANFLSGQCIEAVILGFMFFTSMSLLKFPYPLLVGVMIAFLALIPIFGAFIGCFIGAFLILMVNPIQALWFVVLFLILQQIEGNLIYPHVVGNSVGLPSIWVLFAVTIGGNLMGIIGMLIFIPLCSVIYALFRTYIRKTLLKKEVPPQKLEQVIIPVVLKEDDAMKMIALEKEVKEEKKNEGK